MRRILVIVVLLLGCISIPAADTSSVPQQHDTPPERISVDFSNEEIRTILRNVADMYELNLVVPETLNGRCGTFKYRNVTWQQIFREALAPAGYTFIEDENIVRVVSRETLAEYQSAQADYAVEPEEEQPCELPVWLYWLAAPITLVHLIVTIGVLRDRPPGSARFAPKPVWALAVLVGGLFPLLVYWTIHHSSLAKPSSYGPPPVLS